MNILKTTGQISNKQSNIDFFGVLSVTVMASLAFI